MRKHFYPFAAFVALVWAAQLAHGDLVVDLATGGLPAACSGCGTDGTVFGWSFIVNSPITVDGIGVWDEASLPLTTDAETGLFDDTGTLLASADITNSSTPVPSASTDGQWLFESIAPLTLAPGNYELGTLFFDAGPVAEVGAPFFPIPQITLVEGVVGSPDGGFQAPLTAFGEPVFGPTLETVPEPGLMWLLGLGSAALLLSRASMARRSKSILQ